MLPAAALLVSCLHLDNGTSIFHLLVLEHIADMLFHLSPQVVATVDNIRLVVAASIVRVFCLVFVMPEELLLDRIILLC